MKKIFSTAIIGAFLLIAPYTFAQNSETRTPGTFTELESSGIFDIVLEPGATESIKIESTQLPLSEILTTVEGNTLKISLKEKEYQGDWNDSKKIKLLITYKQLNRIENSGIASIVTSSVLKTSQLSITSGGVGSMELEVMADQLEVELSGASSVNLKGNAVRQHIKVTGAGNVRAHELAGESVEVDATGVGNASVSASKSLGINITGIGNVRYKGEPANLKIKESALGKVKKF